VLFVRKAKSAYEEGCFWLGERSFGDGRMLRNF